MINTYHENDAEDNNRLCTDRLKELCDRNLADQKIHENDCWETGEPVKPGENRLDQILYCGECGEARRFWDDGSDEGWDDPKLGGWRPTYPVLQVRKCACEREKEKLETEKEERELQQRKVFDAKSSLVLPPRLVDATFANWISISKEDKEIKNMLQNYCDDFDAFKSGEYDDFRGLVLCGKMGTGKSYSMACVLNELVQKGVKSFYVPVSTLIVKSQQASMMDWFVDKMLDADLVALDDLGSERDTSFGVEKVRDVVDTLYRYKMPLIITTNIAADVLNNGGSPYDAALSRIKQMCVRIDYNGKDRRALKTQNSSGAASAALKKNRDDGNSK